jgi:hypothetical protein
MPPKVLQVGVADRAAVERVFRGVADKKLRSGSWLAPGNKYLRNTTSRTDAASGGRDVQLARYIAASAPIHAADSARYLGRSVYCHLINDPHAARHFAYYAELRAAMSILASEGIGVFNKYHYVITGNGTLAKTSKEPTHVYTWEAISQWSQDGRAADLIARIVRLNGLRLDDLLKSAFPGMNIQGIATSWFKSWGLDLAVLSSEKNRRNESSYRPTQLTPHSLSTPSRTIVELREFWDSFRPTGVGRFGLIDNNLVRLAFEQQAKGAGVRGGSSNYKALAARVISAAGITDIEETLLTKFMLRLDAVTSRDLPLIAAARQAPSRLTGQADHFSMICRAAILLRMALGSLVLLANGTGLVSAFATWIEGWAVSCGVLAAPLAGNDVLDVWDEVAIALDDIDGAATSSTFAEVTLAAADSMIRLGQCERIALWTLVA